MPRGRAVWGAVPAAPVGPTDPYWANVVLLVGNNNGADGTTTFTDQSASAHTVTAVGNVQWDTAQAPTGYTSSPQLDGNGDALRLDGSADFAYGTGDVCVDGLFRLAAVNIQQVLVDHRPASTEGLYPTIYISSGNKLIYFQSSGNRITGGTTIAVDTWYYYALARVSGTSRLYLGALSGSTAAKEGADYADANNYIVGASRPMLGDSGFTSNSDMNGWHISRVTRSGRGYTGASITIPTLPFPTS